MSVFVAIDFETADRDPDSACSVGLVRVENGTITKKVVQLIQPPRFFFEYAYRPVDGTPQGVVSFAFAWRVSPFPGPFLNFSGCSRMSEYASSS